ncbi:MAG: hypothetical protein M3400_15890, partial [Actinomycetota bacterium]|nr:hypothetical protein [Actinomycetota bacterium]
VSHLVVTSALADGDIATATAAVQAALLAAPDDVKVLVDAVWVAFQSRHEAEAEAIVARIIQLSDVDADVDLDPKIFRAIDRARQLLDQAS